MFLEQILNIPVNLIDGAFMVEW